MNVIIKEFQAFDNFCWISVDFGYFVRGDKAIYKRRIDYDDGILAQMH